MYARNLSIHLKPTSLKPFTEKLEKEIMPLLCKQEGFRNEITFPDDNGTNVTAISLWTPKRTPINTTRVAIRKY